MAHSIKDWAFLVQSGMSMRSELSCDEMFEEEIEENESLLRSSGGLRAPRGQALATSQQSEENPWLLSSS